MRLIRVEKHEFDEGALGAAIAGVAWVALWLGLLAAFILWVV